jgi:hypothetical protein
VVTGRLDLAPQVFNLLWVRRVSVTWRNWIADDIRRL